MQRFGIQRKVLREGLESTFDRDLAQTAGSMDGREAPRGLRPEREAVQAESVRAECRGRQRRD